MSHYNNNDHDNIIDEQPEDADDEKAEEQPINEDALFPRFHKMNLPCKDNEKAEDADTRRQVPFPIIARFQLGGIHNDEIAELIESGGQYNYTNQLLQQGGGSLIVDMSSN